METLNPYAPPQSNVQPVVSPDETLRRAHIDTEATLKTVGILYFLAAFALVASSVAGFSSPAFGKDAESVVVPVALLAFGAGLGFTGYGLRRLRGWTRIPTILISCVGLLGFPMGTLINALILIRGASKKGGFVLTPEYQRIIASTPHVKRKSSILALLLLAILVIVLIGLIAAFATGR